MGAQKKKKEKGKKREAVKCITHRNEEGVRGKAHPEGHNTSLEASSKTSRGVLLRFPCRIPRAGAPIYVIYSV